MGTLTALYRRIRSRGLRRTVDAAFEAVRDLRREWIDAGFDRKYGTDTGGLIDDMSELEVHSRHREHARGYQGIQIPVFRRIIRRIVADLGVDPRGHVFIDFGSGKGRAVMMAAERRFASVHGVELSPVLHRVAEQNRDRFRQRNASASPITLHCQDAADFEIPPGDLVCFFYNPFDGEVLAKVLGNLAAAHEKAPRNLVIAYRNPSCADAFDAHPFLRPITGNATYRLYAARSLSAV